MKRLLLALLLLPAVAVAEQLPHGCYVSFADTTQCWTPKFGPFDWIHYSDSDADFDSAIDLYGLPVAFIVIDAQFNKEWLGRCEATMKTVGALGLQYERERNACLDNFNASEANRQEWITYGTYQANLAKRLRRKCGQLCKRIK